MPASLLSDEMVAVGGFDQCLAIENVHNEVTIRGQYCLLDLRLDQIPTGPADEMHRLLAHLRNINQRFPFVLGICIPSTCLAHEIDYLLGKYFNTALGGSILQSKVEHCQSALDFLGLHKSLFELLKEKNLVIAVSIIGTAAIFVLIGTLIDITLGDHTKEAGPQLSFASILVSFSAIRSTAILFSVKSRKITENDIEGRFSYLHGIRAFLVIWIVAAHSISLLPASISMPVSMLARHPHDIVQMAQNNGFLGNFFNNGTLAVEAFFLISGLLLVALVITKNLQHKVNFVQFVFLRWIRFAPPLLGVIAIWKCFALLGSGPFFADSILNASIQRPCQDSQWWKAFLFVNNWSNLSDTCIPPSWFLSADMQIHVIAFSLIVLLRHRQHRLFYFLCTSLILLSILLPVLLLANGMETFSNLDLFAKIELPSVEPYILFYTGTHMHVGAYFFGAMLGFLLVKNRQQLFSSQTIHSLIWWTSLTVVVTGPFVRTPDSTLVGHLTKGLAVGALHALWTICLGLVVYSLTQRRTANNVRPVKAFLEWPLFRPLSRLSFSMYLCHMIPIWFNVFTRRAPFEVHTANMTLFVLGIICESLLLSYLLFVLFECPSVNLMKVFFNLSKRETKNSAELGTREEDRLTKKALRQLMHNATATGLQPTVNSCRGVDVPQIVITGQPRRETR